MTKKDSRILLLTGDAGLGHRSAAEAIRQALEETYGDHCEVILKNPLDHPGVPEFIRQSESDYDDIIEAAPELYHLGYDISDSSLPVTLMEGGLVLFLFNAFKELILDLNPNLIISTYPIFQAPLAAVIERGALKIPLMTVVTDLVTVHHVWFNEKVTRLTVPTQTVRELALEAGLSENQIIITGIPVTPDIVKLKETDAKAIRKELGWEADPITLLVVGSPRVFDLMEILSALDHTHHRIQFALVAGGNDQLHEEFKRGDWRHPVTIYNFVEMMPKLMRAADIILCKAGGLITTEALASELPIMVINFLPGQEEGNVAYIIDHDAGELCDTPEKAVETLNLWLESNGARLRAISENAAQAGQVDAAEKIAEEAWHLLQNYHAANKK